MNSLYEGLRELCSQRKSVRAFEDKPVPRDLIEKIKDLASTSPYVSGRTNWDILVVTDPDIIRRMAETVREACSDVKKRMRDEFIEVFEQYSENFTFFYHAQVLFVPLFRVAPTFSCMITDPDAEMLQWERDGFVKSISCVAFLIHLAAQSLGLGSCYMTGPLIAEDELREILHVKPGKNIGAIIPVGYPKGA